MYTNPDVWYDEFSVQFEEEYNQHLLELEEQEEENRFMMDYE